MKKLPLIIIPIILLSCNGNNSIKNQEFAMEDSVASDTLISLPVEEENVSNNEPAKSKDPFIGSYYCSRVKNEPVEVIQTDSFSNAFVIQVDRTGKYYIYIPNEADRLNFANMTSIKRVSGDSIWAVRLSDIEKNITIYKKSTERKDVKIKIEADCDVEYQSIKDLMKCLQDAGHTRYQLTTKP